MNASRTELAILDVLVMHKERMIPNQIGYCLINRGDLNTRSPRPNAQGAALMVVRFLHRLEKQKMIDYWDREGDSRGYAITRLGRQVLADQQAKPEVQ